MSAERPLDEVGCRKCGKGDGWKVFTNGKGTFEFRHPCGHNIKVYAIVAPGPVTDKPDPESIDMRFLT